MPEYTIYLDDVPNNPWNQIAKDAITIHVPEGDTLTLGTKVVPAIELDLGRNWSQPTRDFLNFHMAPEQPGSLVLKPKAVYMTKRTMEELREYSSTTPTGVYPGKMWRGHWDDTWYLLWFSEVKSDPNMCAVNSCPILLLDVLQALGAGK